MKKKSNLILILIIIIIIITIILYKYIMSLKNEKQESEHEVLKGFIEGDLKNENDFFTVENCINKFFETLDENNTEGVYNLLNKNYIEKNGINTSNVLQKVDNLDGGFEEFFAKDIYFKELDYGNECQYYVYGQILGRDFGTIKTVYIIANLDFINKTFDIILNENMDVSEKEYLDIMQSIKNNETEELKYMDTNIELNEYNKFQDNSSDNEDGLYHYLKNYSIISVYYPDLAYDLLDEEYRNKRFGTLESYKQYVSDNKYHLLNSSIKEYKISEKEGYKQYIIIDTNGNYYIFKVTDIMKYTLLTDYYTVDVEEIINKYDESNVQERVAINIQKVISALNNKDYKYVYDKLAESFKQNSYPTLDKFKNYISDKIYGNQKLTFKEFTNEGETYIYNIILQGSRASSGPDINMQIIMQLKDNRDFVMSFNIKE